MKDAVGANKEAWEEAFERRSGEYAKDLVPILKKEKLPYLEDVFREKVLQMDLRGKAVAQFSSNNGRELLSLCIFQQAQGVGFDIAENMVAYANSVSRHLETDCHFIATDILKIDTKWHNSFDMVFATVGALAWFEDLQLWFEKAYEVLKPGGELYIHEQHPFLGLFDWPGEDNYHPEQPWTPTRSYFQETANVDNNGMYYMAGNYASRTFTDWQHSLGEIVSATAKGGFILTELVERPHDLLGLFPDWNNRGIPLSFLLSAKKHLTAF